MSVFIINNEWTDIAGATSSQIVDSKYFTSEGEAWEALNIIAESYGTRLYLDETSISLENHAPGLEYEEYYIQELTQG